MVLNKRGTVKGVFLVLTAVTAWFVLNSVLWKNDLRARKGIVKLHLIPNQKNVSSASPSAVSNKTKSKSLDFTENERQFARRALIKEYCKRTGHNAMPRPSSIGVIQPLKILYCITPKCASRQWRAMLFRFGTGGEPTLDRYSQQQQKMMLDTYFKFTFVREPFERILSAYKDKFVNIRKMDHVLLERHGKAILKNFRPNASAQAFQKLTDITFSEFIEYLVKKGSNESTPVMNWHWDNYEHFCGFCGVEYDFIGHYETLEEDSLAVTKVFGKTFDKFNAFRSGVTKPSHTSSEVIKYYSQIPLEWINKLGWMYKSTFEMFNYSFPGPLKSLFKN